jgi:hypothetical protein
MTRISTACSWVNISSPEMAAILAQVGHFYFGAVGQFYIGANTFEAEAEMEIVTNGKLTKTVMHALKPTARVSGAAGAKQ